MKKIISLLLIATFALSLCSCGTAKAEPANNAGTPAEASSDGSLPQVMSSDEYLLYQNIFYNEQGDSFVGKERSFKGVFTVLHDYYSNTVRYYVWGYYDRTKCCDWQWEIVPDSTDNLPEPGSLVQASGVLEKSDSSLDGYWYKNVKLGVLENHKASEFDFDMTTMDATLEYVQQFYISNEETKKNFEGKTVSLYGRIASDSSVQHPYYDGSWQLSFTTDSAVPAIGTMVVLNGKVVNGVITDCVIKETSQY